MKKTLFTALMLFCVAQTSIAQNYPFPQDAKIFSKVEQDFDKDGIKDIFALVGKENEDTDIRLWLFLSSNYKKTKKAQIYEADLRSTSTLKMQGETLIAHLDVVVASCYEQNLEFLYDKKLKDMKLLKYSSSSCGDDGSSTIVDFTKKSYSLSGTERATNATTGEDELKDYNIKGTSDQLPVITFQNINKELDVMYKILADRINKK